MVFISQVRQDNLYCVSIIYGLKECLKMCYYDIKKKYQLVAYLKYCRGNTDQTCRRNG